MTARAYRKNLVGRFAYQALLVSGFCFFISSCDTTANPNAFPNFETLIVTLSSQFPAIWKMLTGLAYVMGLGLILRAVYQLKVYGDARTMMTPQTNLKGTLALFVAGTALIYLPAAFSTLMMSTFGTSTISPLNYQQSSSNMSGQTIVAIFQFIQLIGLVSFVRGWIMVTHSSSGGRDGFGKAMTHIIGGLFAVNIQGTVNMLGTSFGFT